MLYRRLGRTDLHVSELSFGAARGADEDPKRFIEVTRACIDAGINFIDTAESYGVSEEVLGEALQGYNDVIVETKILPYENHSVGASYNCSPQKLIQTVEGSLTRLRRDNIDILLGHGMRTIESYDRFMTDGCYDAMVKLRDQGKVRFIGISELSEGDGTHQILQKAVPTGAFDVVMLTVNFLLQTATESVIPLCRKHDVGTVVMMPLNQASTCSGLVSVEAALECVRRHVERGNLPQEPRYTEPGLLDFLQPYSVPEAALRYVLAQDISTCCVGMRTTGRLQENLRAVAPPYLDAVRLTRLKELFGTIDTQVL